MKTKTKLVPITRAEWMLKHAPEFIIKEWRGNGYLSLGCYETKFQFDKLMFPKQCCCVHCVDCGNLPAKRNGKYIMKKVVKNNV